MAAGAAYNLPEWKKGEDGTVFGETLKTLRRKAGLSQEELAARMNVVRQTISKWENNLSMPDVDQLVALSGILGVPVGTLTGAPTPEPDRADVERQLELMRLLSAQLGRRPRALNALMAAGVALAVLGAVFAIAIMALATLNDVTLNGCVGLIGLIAGYGAVGPMIISLIAVLAGVILLAAGAYLRGRG